MQLAGKMEELKTQEEEIEKIIRQRIDSDRRLTEELTKGVETGAYLLHKEVEEDRLHDVLRREGEKEVTLREIEAVREELIGFMKETKILDRLKEKDSKEFTAEMEKLDQKKIDEMVVMRRPLTSRTGNER